MHDPLVWRLYDTCSVHHVSLVRRLLVEQSSERFSTTEPTDDKEKELRVELKRLFEPDVDDTLWKLQ
nr:hypothetical protein [Tanacetum cinerariifolium]